MDALITRLQEQTTELDTSDLTPAAHLPAVVRRGRRYLVAVSTAAVLGATAAVAGAAVAVPTVLEQLRGPRQPVVEPVAEGDPTEDATTRDEPVKEVDEATVPVPRVDDAVEEPDEPVEGQPAPVDETAPDVVVLSPADGATVTSPKVTFTGEVEPGATVTAGPYEATVTEDGAWSILLIVEEGDTTVTFTATDPSGNAATASVTVTYVAEKGEEAGKDTSSEKPSGDPAPDKPAEDPVVDEQVFTANQKHRELTGEPWTNVYWGTATPGEKVKVLSDFGWGYAYADEGGNWELQVTFDPPGGTKEFDVVARYYHDASVSRTFRLTTVAPEAAAFTASQQQASVPASEPTNVYSGTGEPGHQVLVWTEAHGQVATTVTADGTWQVTLTYTDVAPGQAFAVKVADMSGGTRHWFEVTVT